MHVRVCVRVCVYLGECARAFFCVYVIVIILCALLCNVNLYDVSILYFLVVLSVMEIFHITVSTFHARVCYLCAPVCFYRQSA